MIAKRGWDIADIVEVREIGDPWEERTLAMSDQTRQVAFIVKQACIHSGDTRFGLYAADANGPGRAKKLIETAYLADLSHRPGTTLWTVRADIGAGVQLYDVDSKGQAHPLVVNGDMTDWGGPISGFGGVPHKVGVMSYDWAPDGSALWYSRASPRPTAEREDNGIVFDGRTMWESDIMRSPASIRGTELHYFYPASSGDRILVSGRFLAEQHLRRDWGTVAWRENSQSLEYRRTDWKPSGEWETGWWSVDVQSGETRRLGGPDGITRSALATATDGGGQLSVMRKGDRNHLVELTAEGRPSLDYGPVAFERVSKVLWRSRHKGGPRMIVQVHYQTRDGLVFISRDRKMTELASEHHLRGCTFNRDGEFGACVRESLTLPPEVVAISPKDGRIRMLARPNAHYDEIAPLVHEHAKWTNRYGNTNDGYITYPRNYVAGRKYPTVVITHGRDARDQFAHPGLLWDFHVNVFAERGYLVLSVNEAPESHRFRASIQNRVTNALKDGVAKVQFNVGLDAVASMEAALDSLQRAGIADSARAGIAGWSRGAEVVQYTMSQSKVFKAGILGDGYWGANAYWGWGANLGGALARGIYGGSPYDSDPQVIANYRRFAPAFRTREFAGPVLMLFRAGNALLSLELRTFLADAGVPNELVFFPHEGHVFWYPRHRAAVMQRSLEWFDYWLRGVRDPDPANAKQYARWDAMAVEWRKVQSARVRAQGRPKQDH